MKVSVRYNQSQLDAAVTFVSKYNEFYKGMDNHIRDTILKMIADMAADPDVLENGTMGFIVLVDHRVFEGIESDTNYIHFDILVDPNLGNDTYEPYEEVIDV